MPKGVYARPAPPPAIRRGGSVFIPLCGKNGRGLFAIVSARDFPLVRSFRWHVSYVKADTLYAQAHRRRADGRDTTVQMHKLILSEAVEVDHRNGDGLDNRRRNLRKASKMANRRNRFVQRNNKSGYRGVRYNAQTKRHWLVCIGGGRKGVRVYLGLFRTARAGARAYDRAARRRFGAFARLNFPRKGERSVRRR